MKTILFAAVLSTTANCVMAADEAASSHQISGTATVTSEYIFRGLTQTWGGPAMQGSIDYVHASGLWATLWGSTLSEKVIAGSNVELNFAAGYKGAINDQWTYGAGFVAVYFPGGNWKKVHWGPGLDQRYDFVEANVFVGYRWVTLKYSQTLNDLLGFNEKTGFSSGTKGSSYAEINVDIPLMDTGITLGLHAARQDIKASAGGLNPDFNDYRIALSKTFDGGWVGTVQVTENSNSSFYNGTRSNLDENYVRDIGKRRYGVALTKLF